MENSFALDRPLWNSIGSMTMCLCKSEIRVGVFGLNLILAPLILVTINMLWFWSSRALTGSVYASAGFFWNRSVLDVMSIWKYHFSHMEMMITQRYRTGTLSAISIGEV